MSRPFPFCLRSRSRDQGKMGSLDKLEGILEQKVLICRGNSLERGEALHDARMVEELQWGEELEKMDKRAISQILVHTAW